ncbi:protein krueppel-like [Sabethes cyaneus]|uniref:protein krueppel-like n=1 Tax=Sabethes cyaneus TaxID=53552 RepID=UPI00237E208C|nr:protein krueppel-like [Sabethes cyaneus]
MEFSSYVNLNEHTCRDRPFKCTECGKAFFSGANLKNHTKTHNAYNNKSYQCSFCERNFTASWTLNKHMKVHTDQQLYGCNYCECYFAQQEEAAKHEARHKPKRQGPALEGQLPVDGGSSIAE